ncbi:MAG: hypothetical protein IJU44_03385 [Kiritimatiellae bacterium]|nr:hypothetical protein [Kiritimatiellia bacterium]
MAWDPTMIKEGKTIAQRAHIVYSRFKEGDTKDGTKYSLGGLYVRKVVSYVSKKALKEILSVFPDSLVYDNDGRRVGIDYGRVTPEKCGVTREHMIPVNEAFQYMNRLFSAGRLTEDTIKAFMPKLHIALITREENSRLSAAHYSRKMPKGWWDSPALNPLERYRAAGLGDDIWVMDFLNDDMSPRWQEA